MRVWIIGRETTLPNGHKQIVGPFVAFETNEQAQAACDLVADISGERPAIVSGAFYRKGESMTHSPTRDPQ